MTTPEDQARETIDTLLTQAGWVIQDANQVNLTASRGVVIRNFPLEKGHGFADYLFYLDGKAAGVIEAKREGATLTGVEIQSAKYSGGFPPSLPVYVRPLPFLYQSTGVETRFTNELDPEPRSRPTFSFHKPETLAKWLEEARLEEAQPIPTDKAALKGKVYKTFPTLRKRLKKLPPLKEEGLWPAQKIAVNNLKRIKANLKRYKAAVEGKLTEAWRKEHLPAPTSRPGKFYTYAILCKDDSIYIGHTDDIERRWNEHLKGKGAEWTKDHKPVKVAHYEEFDSRQEAADREKWLKTGFGRKWIKRELAAGRTRQAGQIEPASKLLARILAARRVKWERTEINKRKIKGHVAISGQWKNRYKAPIKLDEDVIADIPPTWEEVSLDSISSLITDGKHGDCKDETGSGYYFLSAKDVHDGKLHYSEARQINKDEFMEVHYRTNLELDDVLITNAGTIGRVAIAKDKEKLPFTTFQKSVAIIKPINPFVSSGFLAYHLEANVNKMQAKSAGTAVKNLLLSTLKATSFCLPPRDEQLQIVEEVERRLSIIEECEATVEANLTRAARLRQSILQTAFSGKLLYPHSIYTSQSGLEGKEFN